MWLYTKQGFYSIVKDGNKYAIRSRNIEHHNNAIKLFNDINADVIASINTDEHNRDYAHRIIVSNVGLSHFLARLRDTIDYPNFKSAIPFGEYQDVLYNVYNETLGLNDT